MFCNGVPKKPYLLPGFQALQVALGVKHSLPARSVVLLSCKVLKGFKNRWMERELGRGSLCVMACQQASWLAPTVSCTLKKGH